MTSFHYRLFKYTCLLITIGSTFAVSAQLPDQEDFPEMSIAELIDIGGKPTGWWAMQGMPWPIDELINRPKQEVSREALDCLQREPAYEYSHAFCVKLLIRLRFDSLDELLIESFPTLNQPGQYEVLLNGQIRAVSSYAPLFVQALRGLNDTDKISKPAALAASYATRIYNQDLFEELDNYVNNFSEGLPTPEYGYFVLDGFPYSDVIQMNVRDVGELFNNALSVGNGMSNETRRQMSPLEERTLISLRTSVIEPGRIDLGLPNRPSALSSIIQSLEQLYPAAKFEPLREELNDSKYDTAVAGNSLALVDALAQLCNSLGISIDKSGYNSDSWAISAPPSYPNFQLSNRCQSRQGFLFSLRTSGSVRDYFQVIVSASSTHAWPNSFSQTFRLNEVTSASGESLADQFDFEENSKRFRILLNGRSLDELGTFNISGTYTYRIPTKLRIIERDSLPGDVFQTNFSPFELSYTDEEDVIKIEFGVPSSCCSRRNSPSSFDSGWVTLLNEGGNVLLSSTGVPFGSDRSLQAINLYSGGRNFQQPTKLVWVFAPETEQISIDVEFENVSIVRSVQ